jgi:hypothetical protein
MLAPQFLVVFNLAKYNSFLTAWEVEKEELLLIACTFTGDNMPWYRWGKSIGGFLEGT